MAQLLGRAFIKVDGALLRSDTGASIDLGGIVRTAVNGNAVHGYYEAIKQAVVQCQVSLAKGDTLESLRDSTDVTVTFECDTGQTYIVRGAWLVNPPVITEGNGGAVALQFEGQPAEEVGS